MGDKEKKSEKKGKKVEFPYSNRELSWLDFNIRVLEEAYKKTNPPFERMKFLAITASNMDEFFEIRVSAIREQANSGYKGTDPSGFTPPQLLSAIHTKVHEFCMMQYSCLLRSILPALRKNNIFILKPQELDEKQKQHARDYFDRVLYPVLTPMAIDPSRPFPLLSNKSLNLAVRLTANRETCFAVVQVPSILPRFIDIPCESGKAFIALEDIIIQNLNKLFELHKIKAVAAFRITRNTDLTIDEDAEDLLEEMEKSIKKRKRGKPVRLEIQKNCDEASKIFLISMLKMKKEEIYTCSGPLDLTAWMKFSLSLGAKELLLPPIEPVIPADFWQCRDIFAAIRERDRMVHHPYESFQPVVDFVAQAAVDPDVLAIKQTLYRVGGNSPIIAELIKAAENGKQVTVLVELKARFDEENNIQFAKKLEKAGCHVIYGLKGVKTHCKILLVVRREAGGIRRYMHMSTGNYNCNTAKLYTDIGLFTCQEDFGEDATALFNSLTGYSSQPSYRKMLLAPEHLRGTFYKMIDREMENSRQGLPAGITVKINSLMDVGMTEKLYNASQAGVPIRLIVRGICSLIPGLPKFSENISVISIVGQLLEHSRIFRFENGGDPQIYLGSADWMTRNLDHRIELTFPVEDKILKDRLFASLDVMLRDTVNARCQDAEAHYFPVDKRGKPLVNSQLELAAMARQRTNQLEKESLEKSGLSESNTEG